MGDQDGHFPVLPLFFVSTNIFEAHIDNNWQKIFPFKIAITPSSFHRGSQTVLELQLFLLHVLCLNQDVTIKNVAIFFVTQSCVIFIHASFLR